MRLGSPTMEIQEKTRKKKGRKMAWATMPPTSYEN